MKIRKLALSIFVALIVVAVQPALGRGRGKGPGGHLDAPENFTATVMGNEVVFSWDAVEGADRYSIEVEAYVMLDGVMGPVSVDLSYGTRNPGLTVPVPMLCDDIAAALDVAPGAIRTLDAWAKVKALNPGKGRGPQNNPFSEPDDFSIWIAD